MTALSTTVLNVAYAPLELRETTPEIVSQWFNVFRAAAERNELWDRWEPVSRDEATDHQSTAPEPHNLVAVQPRHSLFQSIENVMTGAVEVLELMAIRPLTYARIEQREFLLVVSAQLVGENRSSVQVAVCIEIAPKTSDRSV